MITKTNIQQKFDIKIPLNNNLNKKEKKLNLNKGEKVCYIGKHKNGPAFGSFGTIKNTLNKLAIVDLGVDGTWKIPYFYIQSIKI